MPNSLAPSGALAQPEASLMGERTKSIGVSLTPAWAFGRIQEDHLHSVTFDLIQTDRFFISGGFFNIHVRNDAGDITVSSSFFLEGENDIVGAGDQDEFAF